MFKRVGYAALLGVWLLRGDAHAAEALRHHVPFVYYLQHLDKAQLEKVNPAVAVIDPYDAHLSPRDIDSLQRHYKQQLFAYISAGEVDPSRRDVEDGYRYLPQWDKAEWIIRVPNKAQNNTRWATKRVEYWHPEWMTLMTSRAQEMARRGYNGVMLDTVDTFDAFRPYYKNRDVVADMACLVAAVRKAGRAVKSDFKVFINGGMELYNTKCPTESGDFLSTIDGQLKEDTWYNERGSAKAEWTKDDLAYLRRAIEAGKPVFTIDYFTNEQVKQSPIKRMKDYMKQAQAFGVIPYAADRELGRFLSYNQNYYADDAAWTNAVKYGVTP